MVETRPHGILRTLSVLAASAIAPAAVLFAPTAAADPGSGEVAVAPGEAALPCCAENLPEAPADLPIEVPAEVPGEVHADLPGRDSLQVVPAAHVHDAPEALPPGDAPEGGLQRDTIRLSRVISADFPQIHTMIGVRPDAKPWHPSGRAVDIMIPNHGSAEGIALGDAIRDFALANAGRFGIQDVIWRGTYYTPAGPSGSGYGHYDHVHITTFGGGYPG